MLVNFVLRFNLDHLSLRNGRLDQGVVAQHCYPILLSEFQLVADVLLERQMADLVLNHQDSVDPLNINFFT